MKKFSVKKEDWCFLFVAMICLAISLYLFPEAIKEDNAKRALEKERIARKITIAQELGLEYNPETIDEDLRPHYFKHTNVWAKTYTYCLVEYKGETVYYYSYSPNASNNSEQNETVEYNSYVIVFERYESKL